MKSILTSFIFLLIACDHRVERWVCTCEQNEKVKAFVTANIKSANNMSDEEMEDVIHELYKVGVKTNCEDRIIMVDSKWIPLDSIKKCESIIDFL